MTFAWFQRKARPRRIFLFPMHVDELNMSADEIISAPWYSYNEFGKRMLMLSDRHRLDPDYSDKQYKIDRDKLINTKITQEQNHAN